MEANELFYYIPSLSSKVECPIDEVKFCSPIEMSVYNTIVHLNDDHHWTREMVADWLETLDIDISFTERTSDVCK